MKPRIFMTALALLLASFELCAQDMYQRLNYRDNDPFLFCEQGQDIKKAPMRCWMPLPPFTGNFMVMPYCHPNPYGKSWSSDDTLSLREYLTVCPAGITPGRWEGPGQKDMTPHQH